MSFKDSGYATLAVTALMTGLSLIALSLLNLASQESQKASKLSERLVADIEIDGAFNRTIVEIVNGQIPMSSSHIEYAIPMGDEGAVVRISLESAKTNLKTSTTVDIQNALANSNLPSSLQKRVQKSLENSSGIGFKTVKDLATHSNTEINCLRKALTEFYSSGADQTLRTKFVDGAVVRIQILDNKTGRHADGTILLTGKRADPVWLVDWSRNPELEASLCI